MFHLRHLSAAFESLNNTEGISNIQPCCDKRATVILHSRLMASPASMSLPVGIPKYELSSTVSPGSPVSDSPECTNAGGATVDAYEQPESSTSKVDNTPESEEREHVTESRVQPSPMRDARTGDGINDAVVLSEVRSSLSTISNGVEELATTVRDFFGISDSDSDSSLDYDRDSNGRRTHLNWGRLRSHAKRRRRLRLQKKSGQANVTKEESEYDGEESGKHPRIIPDVRECDFAHFQSRPARDGNELHCVDILIAGDELDSDIREFNNVVVNIESGALTSWKPEHVSERIRNSSSQDPGKKWMRRIRINSRAVMTMLRILHPEGGKKFLGRPSVFHRPFQLLVSSYDSFQEQLTNIKKVASGGNNEGAEFGVSTLNMNETNDRDNQIKKLSDNKNAVAELICFADFMESRIMPDARRYRDASSPLPKTIRHEDLWYLLKPGDLIYVPRDTSSRDPFRSTPFSQSFLRVIQTNLGNRNWSPIPVGGSNDEPWSIFGHLIEYDGNSYAPVHVNLSQLPRYTGERKVTELPFYPVSYLEDDQPMTQAQLDGETYISLIQRRSGFYSGWTQTVDPLGVQITENSPEGRILSPEHIESDILVDFQETFNAIPAWKPEFYEIVIPDEGTIDKDVGSLTRDSDQPILEWDEMGRTRTDQYDTVIVYDATEAIEARSFLSEDPLGQFREATRRAPTGEFRALLPKRFFGYAVLERKFVQLSTRFVRSAELEANDKAFENLEINRIYKQLILALVKSHFDKVETEKRTNVEIESQDLIRGKGKGVVILLHGVPGVGKTATAEAVALKWKKPLFPITCGDLGYTADMLEKSLNEIFRLAHHWGCILLLDEADVFITQRERHDLKRNALVSGEDCEGGHFGLDFLMSMLTFSQAFLRVLEYYNGIMFLTTNRAGVLDEAIKSRVHLNLYYDHLTEEQTVAIFKQHIQRLRNIEKQRNPDQNEQIMVLHKEIIQFARDHYNQSGSNNSPGNNFGRWNGRQIRNAFLIASSLAHYDSEDEGDEEDKDDLAEHGRKKQKQLGRSQFEIVAKTTLMYDQYRQSVHSGKSDDHVAFDREERAMLSQPRSPTPDRLKKTSMGFN